MRNRKLMKQVLAASMTAAIALTTLVACAPPSTESAGTSAEESAGGSAGDGAAASTGESSKTEKVLRFATLTEPTSLDPQLGSGKWITTVTGAIFEGLVRRYNGEILPGMAESWEISDDNLTYTFHLRDASWNDGVPITAQDFIDSWDLLIQRATPMAQFTDYFTVDGKANATALDDKTLEVTLNYPVPFMMDVFAMSATTVVRTDKYAEGGDAYYQSVPEAMNGPFLLTEWRPNDVMVLEPNPDYWDAGKVNFSRVEIYTVKDDTTQVNMYENGEIDILTVPETMYADFEDKGIMYYEDGSNFYIQFTTDGQTDETAKYLANRDFIEAVSACIDREDFVNSVYGGAYQPTTEFVPTSATGYKGGKKADANVTIDSPFTIKADLTKAQEKLDSALETLGATVDAMPSFTLVVSDAAVRQTAAQYIQDVCSQIGIKIEIDTIPSATFWSTLREGYRYDFALAGTGPDVDDASTFLKIFDGEGLYADTFMRWHSDEYAEILADSWVAADETQRTEDLVAMEEYLLSDGPIIPLYFTRAAWLMADGFTNINRNMTGADLDYVFGDKTP